MTKHLKTFLIATSIVICIGFGFTAYSNISYHQNISDDMPKKKTEAKTENNLSKEKEVINKGSNQDENKANEYVKDKTVDTTNQSSTSSNSSTKETVSTKKATSDYVILVSSPIKNALVTLYKDSKEINIKVLSKNIDNVKGYDRYINITNENIKYLSNNIDTLLNDFKKGGLLEKYSIVTNMLQSYDTNLNSGDLVKIGLMYMK